jgi:RNA polymerase sigma-70 factor (ECF subfamily)
MTGGDFKTLVREHRDRVYGLALYSLHNREDAEDITQEVLIRLWKHRRKVDPEGVRPWLLKVTRNACCDTVRKRRVQIARLGHADTEAAETMPASSPTPHAEAESADFQRRLSAAIARLPEPLRSVVILREIQQLKYDEIAMTLEKPLNSIKVYLHRGRKLLREELREVETYVRAS